MVLAVIAKGDFLGFVGHVNLHVVISNHVPLIGEEISLVKPSKPLWITFFKNNFGGGGNARKSSPIDVVRKFNHTASVAQ